MVFFPSCVIPASPNHLRLQLNTYGPLLESPLHLSGALVAQQILPLLLALALIIVVFVVPLLIHVIAVEVPDQAGEDKDVPAVFLRLLPARLGATHLANVVRAKIAVLL